MLERWQEGQKKSIMVEVIHWKRSLEILNTESARQVIYTLRPSARPAGWRSMR